MGRATIINAEYRICRCELASWYVVGMSAFRLAVSEFSSPGTLARASSSWLGGLLGGWRKGSPLETKIETEQEEEHPK